MTSNFKQSVGCKKGSKIKTFEFWGGFRLEIKPAIVVLTLQSPDYPNKKLKYEMKREAAISDPIVSKLIAFIGDVHASHISLQSVIEPWHPEYAYKDTNKEKLLTTCGAARLLGVSRWTVSRAADAGELQFISKRGKRFFKRSELLRWDHGAAVVECDEETLVAQRTLKAANKVVASQHVKKAEVDPTEGTLTPSDKRELSQLVRSQLIKEHINIKW